MKIAFASLLGDDSVFDVDELGFVTCEGTAIGWVRDEGVEVFEEEPEILPWAYAAHRALLLRQVQAALRPPQKSEFAPESPAALSPLEVRLKELEARLADAEAKLSSG